MPLPPFEQLEASIDGLSEEDLMRFREPAMPEPGSIMRETVRLKNDARRDVPATIIACSYPSEVIMQMAHEGHPMMAEVGNRDRGWPLTEQPSPSVDPSFGRLPASTRASDR